MGGPALISAIRLRLVQRPVEGGTATLTLPCCPPQSARNALWLTASTMSLMRHNFKPCRTAAGQDAPENEYEAVTCNACTRLHFLNRRTGKLLGQEDE